MTNQFNPSEFLGTGTAPGGPPVTPTTTVPQYVQPAATPPATPIPASIPPTPVPTPQAPTQPPVQQPPPVINVPANTIPQYQPQQQPEPIPQSYGQYNQQQRTPPHAFVYVNQARTSGKEYYSISFTREGWDFISKNQSGSFSLSFTPNREQEQTMKATGQGYGNKHYCRPASFRVKKPRTQGDGSFNYRDNANG